MWVDGHLAFRELAAEQVIQALPRVVGGSQDLGIFFIRAERAVVAQVLDGPAKAERVFPFGIAEVLIRFTEILGSAKGDSGTRRGWQVAWQLHGVGADG